MNARDVIRQSIDMGGMVCTAYLQDLTDEQLLQRPAPGCNHINWQVGHLIASENYMISQCVAGSMPPLPDGFAEKYSKDAAKLDDPEAFCSKQELMQAFETQRKATLAALDKVSDAELDKPSPEAMQAYAPNVAAAFNMQGSHWLMHAGQWAVVRRQLGKPPLF
jgi:hypothetical protein